MSDAFDRGGAANNASSSGSSPSTPRPTRSGGFFARFFAALLVIVITTAITLLTVAAIFFSLGFSLNTPQQIALGQTGLATAQAQNNALQLQNNVIQTEVANLDRRNSHDRESLDEVRKTVADLNGLRAQLSANDLRSATAVAAARSSGDQVAALATAEAGRIVLLEQIARRSERVERFLQRLSDISGDAAVDTSGATPSVLPSTSATAATAPSPTDLPPLASSTALALPTNAALTTGPAATIPATATAVTATPIARLTNTPTAVTATLSAPTITPVTPSPSVIAATPTSTPRR